ncbi:MAG: ornithine monooxygenase, partial [Acidobacteria bacterium]|nr:ornithine monooxygenase [Acidobacteriota bacterium]
FVEVRRAYREGQGVCIEVRDMLRGGDEVLEADGLVVATGYRWGTRHPLLEPLAPFLEQRADGEYRVERDYGIAAADGFKPRIYLQGYCEATHGISETVLSLLPMRAQDIWRSLEARLAEAAAEPVAALPGPAGAR